jgi:hypothetical protein
MSKKTKKENVNDDLIDSNIEETENVNDEQPGENIEDTKQEKTKKEKKKSWYVKDSFFTKSKVGVKKTGNKGTPAEVVKPVNYISLYFKGVKETFNKNIPLTNQQVEKFSQYQKDYYLELR